MTANDCTVNELLCFLLNIMNTMPADLIAQLVGDFYDEKEVVGAIECLLSHLPPTNTSQRHVSTSQRLFHTRRRECQRRVPPSRRCPPDARGRKPTDQEPAVEETKRCIRCLLGGTEAPTPASPFANSSEPWRRC